MICLVNNQFFAYKNFVLISAPGSGKGTFSQYFVEKYGYAHICPGDIFRNEINTHTELGKKIEPLTQNGELVDEGIVCQIVADNLSKAIQQNKNFIIDGFPRTETAFTFLHKYLEAHNLTKEVCWMQFLASDDTCIQRILGRQVCTNCFRIYNVTSAQSNDKINCDGCGTKLIVRQADTEESAKKRLQNFHAHTESLVNLAKKFYEFITIETEHAFDDLKTYYNTLIK